MEKCVLMLLNVGRHVSGFRIANIIVVSMIFSLRDLGPCLNCVSTIRCNREIDSSLLPCRRKRLPSKLVVGLSQSIHHSCSTFSWACLLFFTEIPPLNLQMLGLSFVHLCYFLLFLADGLHFYNFLPCSSFPFLSSHSASACNSLPPFPDLFCLQSFKSFLHFHLLLHLHLS